MKSDYTVYDYFLMMSLISFLGFLLENIWISVRKGCVDNRNMKGRYQIRFFPRHAS